MFLVGSRVTFSHRTTFFLYFFSEDLQNFSSNICQKNCSDQPNQPKIRQKLAKISYYSNKSNALEVQWPIGRLMGNEYAHSVFILAESHVRRNLMSCLFTHLILLVHSQQSTSRSMDSIKLEYFTGKIRHFLPRYNVF